MFNGSSMEEGIDTKQRALSFRAGLGLFVRLYLSVSYFYFYVLGGFRPGVPVRCSTGTTVKRHLEAQQLPV
jgi:hypothetical protein